MSEIIDALRRGLSGEPDPRQKLKAQVEHEMGILSNPVVSVELTEKWKALRKSNPTLEQLREFQGEIVTLRNKTGF